MKKRLLSVLLLVCMVLTLLPTAAFAEDMHEHDALPAATHTHCFCGGSVNAGEYTNHEDVTYTAYNNASSLKQILKSDSDDVIYAYLTNNITLDRLYLPEGKTLYLCLNGHRITFDEYQVTLNNNTTLYLCDCSTEKTGTISRSGGKTCCVLVSGENATFNMYGGTLRDGNSTGIGGGVKLEKGTMNMYGGTITNNTVTTNESRHGGGVYVESNFKTGVGKISISGSPVITGNTRTYTPTSTTTTENVYLSYGFTNSGDLPIVKLGTLTSGADIGIWAGVSVFSDASETDYSGYFSSDVAGYHVEYNAEKKLELKAGEAHVHTGGTATCTELAVCSECKKPYGSVDPNNHSGTLGEWQSNDDNHWKEYSCCHAHAEEGTHTGGTATCTAEAVCATCGKKYGDLAAHDFTAQVAGDQYLTSAADCEKAAVYYKSCRICGLSSKGTADEATFTSGNILGHDWGEPEYTWTPVADGYMCSARKVCQRCSTDVAEIATVTYAVTTAPTCLNDGTGTYTATFSAEFGFPAQTKTIPLSATGHSWGEATYSWRSHTTYFTCTAKRVCQNDSTHEETETVTADYSVVTEPTCLETGSGRYQASFEADWAVDQSSTVTLAALGHDFGAWTSNGDGTHTRICSRDASHTETGDCTGGTATCTAKAVCETCGGAYGALASHNFTAETVDEKYLKSAATCTEKAVYYKSCSACGLTSKGTADEATFESGVALDHNWGAWTSNGNGTHTRTCKRDTSHTETGDCTGGTATCTAKAVCETCGGAYGAKDPDNHTGKLAWDITETHHEQAWTCCGLITVAKAAHTFGDWVVTKRPTSREEGEKARTCSVCGYTETKVLPKTGGGPTYYTLVFESNGGSKITNVNERHGTVVDLTLAKYQPTRTGYDFTGWYSDKTLTRRVTSIKLYENTTVYAGWSTRELPFTDVVRGDWFFDDVRYVYETGLMNGVSATRFAPYGSTTRGMIVTILYRMEGQPAVSRDCPFTDVASGSYYERAITWAAANGIVTGHSSTIFAPDASITREQLAAILYRYAVYKGLDVSVGENTNILSYEDFASLSEYAIPAMQWACGAGVLYGFGGSLLPDAPANRLQAAAILHRFCVNILN